MADKKNSLSEKYFNDVYEANKDPWNFEASGYEKQKYAVTMQALTKPLYENVFEIGCSIGVLSELLAAKATRLLAVDAAEAPLVQARERLQKFPEAQVAKMNVPFNFGEGMYDLIVISEVAYYLNDYDLEVLRSKTINHLVPGGQLLMVHWTPVVHDYPQTGDAVHDYFMQFNNKGLTHLLNQRYETYRLDLFEKS